VTLISVQGAATVRRSGAEAALPAARGARLATGDVIRTGPRSRATLLLPDGTEVRVNANTVLLIREPAPAGGFLARLRLTIGEIWARVTRGRRMAIETPTAIAGVRGTELDLAVVEDGAATLTVVEGEVRFFNEQGAVLVRDGGQSLARPGRAPTPPVTVNVPFLVEWTDDAPPADLPLETTYISPDPKRLAAALKEAEAMPPGPLASLRLGDVRHDRGELEAALAAYEAALGGEGGREGVLRARIGQTLLELGRLPEAEAAFRRALTLLDGEPDAERRAPSAGLVMTLLSRRETEAALTAAREAVARDERSALLQTALAFVHLRRGEQDAAGPALDRALAADPEYAPALAGRALLLRARGEPAEARAAAERAVAQAPYSSLAHQALADALFALGETPAARKAAARAVALDPLRPGARVALGRALLQEGEIERAAAEAARAAALGPDLSRARFFYGLVLAEQRRLPRAERELRRAVVLDPGDLESRALLARVLLEQGREGDAVAVAREAVARDPDSVAARTALGRVYWQAGRLAEAATEYRAALSQAPESLVARLELARVSLDRNDLPDALANALAAVARAPVSAEARALLGLVYDRMGAPDQAQRQYRDAIALDPDNALARLGMGASAGAGTGRLRELRRVLAGQSAGAALRRRLLQFVDSDLAAADGLREVAQGMLRDPAALALLFEPGVTTEIAPGVASEESLSLDLTHRDRHARGRLYDLVFGRLQQGENYRDERSERRDQAWINLAAAPDHRLRLLGQYFHLGSDLPRPGAEANPDLDDRSGFRDNWWDLSARRSLGPDTLLWLHAGNRLSNATDENPGAPIDADLTALVRSQFRQLGLEGRVDHRWGRGHTSTYTLSLGRFHLGTLERTYDIARSAFVEREIAARGDVVAHTLQDAWRPGRRLSLVVGATAERYAPRARAGLAGGVLRDAGFQAETSLLPFAQATFFPGARDQVRAVAHRRRRRPFDFLLQPSEAFLLGEPVGVAVGSAVTWYEVDWERRFSPGRLATLFAYHGNLDEWFIAPAVRQTPDLIGFRFREARLEGFGLRYDQQITPFLTGSARYLYREAIDATEREQGEGRATRGRQILMQPRNRAALALNYVDRAGSKAFLEAVWTSKLFLDRTGDEPPFPSKLVVNLRFGREPSVRREWTVRIDNLFNTRTLYWPDFPAPGRTVELQYRVRF
jgi:tetratricopeptide (TPR) repeat protein